MVEDATRGLDLGNTLPDYKKVQEEIQKKMIQDKIHYLEAMGYRIILNNTKNNTNRDNDMKMILEANGYKVTKEE